MPDIIYTRVHDSWEDEPSTNTPINAAALERIEDGIVAVTEQANAALSAVEADVASLKMAFKGSYVAGNYSPGDVVKFGNSSYVCTTPITVDAGTVVELGSSTFNVEAGATPSFILPGNPAVGDVLLMATYGLGSTVPVQNGFTALNGHSGANFGFGLYFLTVTEEIINSQPLTLFTATNSMLGVVSMFRNAVVTDTSGISTSLTSPTLDLTNGTTAFLAVGGIFNGQATAPGVNDVQGIFNSNAAASLFGGYVNNYSPVDWTLPNEGNAAWRAQGGVILQSVPTFEAGNFEKLV